MKYTIIVQPKAKEHLSALRKSEPLYYEKALMLIRQLSDTPRSGIGHPKPLGGDREGEWSSHISHKHRLLYKIRDEVVTVVVIAAYGHYDDR